MMVKLEAFNVCWLLNNLKKKKKRKTINWNNIRLQI